VLCCDVGIRCCYDDTFTFVVVDIVMTLRDYCWLLLMLLLFSVFFLTTFCCYCFRCCYSVICCYSVVVDCCCCCCAFGVVGDGGIVTLYIGTLIFNVVMLFVLLFW